ncbi:MAG: potassium channel protein [Desulfobacterales bacterium]|jgi:voltage-gated potassium channel|nr:potassium channel protein [Desulfobacteraceae bacterium]MBT7085805.1 potassium channel protein [Desulfobacterales bacterium]MBT7695977.1 potassium channel protein [Desulfobacterales bacterium]
MSIRQRLNILIGAILLVVLTGSGGYYFIFHGKHSIIDCLYMTIISLTSVGYGEVLEVTGNVPAQIFTMVLITFGMGIILYGISTLTALLIEGELSGILRKNKMYKQISKLNQHYIVCGGGQTGRPLIEELVKNKEPTILIENDESMIDQCKDLPDLLLVEGDATEDQTLIDAGIEKARGIIITLPSDKDTLYVTMTARMLNKNIRIISRIVDPRLEKKMIMAGASSVVSPNFIGAMRMASVMIRPATVDFLDQMLRTKDGDLRIHDIRISEGSGVIGKKIGDLNMREKHGLVLLGSKAKTGEIKFNPSFDKIVEAEMVLIVMGDVSDIAKFRDKY